MRQTGTHNLSFKPVAPLMQRQLKERQPHHSRTSLRLQTPLFSTLSLELLLCENTEIICINFALVTTHGGAHIFSYLNAVGFCVCVCNFLCCLSDLIFSTLKYFLYIQHKTKSLLIGIKNENQKGTQRAQASAFAVIYSKLSYDTPSILITTDSQMCDRFSSCCHRHHWLNLPTLQS